MLGRGPARNPWSAAPNRRPQDERENKRKALLEIERILLHIGRFAFFSVGYYYLSRWIVNWWLSNFTETGWQFDWNLFGK